MDVDSSGYTILTPPDLTAVAVGKISQIVSKCLYTLGAY